MWGGNARVESTVFHDKYTVKASLIWMENPQIGSQYWSSSNA